MPEEDYEIAVKMHNKISSMKSLSTMFNYYEPNNSVAVLKAIFYFMTTTDSNYIIL